MNAQIQYFLIESIDLILTDVCTQLNFKIFLSYCLFLFLLGYHFIWSLFFHCHIYTYQINLIRFHLLQYILFLLIVPGLMILSAEVDGLPIIQQYLNELEVLIIEDTQ